MAVQKSELGILERLARANIPGVSQIAEALIRILDMGPSTEDNGFAATSRPTNSSNSNAT